MTPRNYYITIDWLRHEQKYVVLVRLANMPDETTIFDNYNVAFRYYLKQLSEIK